MYSRSKYIVVAHNEVNDLGSDGATDALASLGHSKRLTWKRMDLVRLRSDHDVARPPRRAVPRKIRFTLRLRPLNTEIFSKRRKIYSICSEDLRWWSPTALPPRESLLPWSTRLESGEWADPGGTAMPGRLVTRPEQAPEPHPLTKISLISKGTHGPRIRY